MLGSNKKSVGIVFWESVLPEPGFAMSTWRRAGGAELLLSPGLVGASNVGYHA